MSFLEILQKIVDDNPGCTGGIVIGIDGIVIEQYVRENESIDFQNIGVEYTTLMKSISDTSHTLGFEEPDQLVVEYQGMTLIVRSINKDYFVILAMNRSGNIGKARFLLRKNILNLSREL